MGQLSKSKLHLEYIILPQIATLGEPQITALGEPVLGEPAPPKLPEKGKFVYTYEKSLVREQPPSSRCGNPES
jgi:hypothetical protein